MVAKVVGNLAVSDKDKEEDGQSSVPKGSFATIIKKLVAKAKDKGFITYDELNKALPAEEFSSEQIEDAMASFSDMGLQIVESEDDVDESEDESDEKAIINPVVISPMMILAVPMTLCGCTCGKWARLSCCPVKARLRLPNASRLAVS